MRLQSTNVKQIWMSDDDYRFVYSRTPRLAVVLIIRTKNGIILSLRSLKDWHGQWHLPGGRINYRESVEDAATRISLKELGISIQVERTLDYIEYPSELVEREFEHTVDIALLCRATSLATIPNHEASEIRIFSRIPDNIIKEQGDFLRFHNVALCV